MITFTRSGRIPILNLWPCMLALLLGASSSTQAISFSEQILLAGHTNRAFWVHAEDLDDDGDRDILSASMNDGKIAWYENTDGQGAMGEQQVITDAAFGAVCVITTDVDGDGDPDVLSAAFHVDDIAWYENTDGQGGFGPAQIITEDAYGVMSIFAADFDGDGDPDLAAAVAGENVVAWYENTDGQGGFGPRQVISSDAAYAQSVHAADLDGDGDQDAISGSYEDDTIAWYENLDGAGDFGEAQVISTDADGAYSVFSIDLDGDGDVDVLSASYFDTKIAWYENTDGEGSFGDQTVISTDVLGPHCVFANDLDGDGDADVLSASHMDDKIAWYENLDGEGDFGEQQVITTGADDALCVFSADLDGDGDADVLSASGLDDVIGWYENTDGEGAFGPRRVVTAGAVEALDVIASDLDGDGDPDVVSASYGDDKIAWYENLDGQGDFGPQRVVTTAADGARSVFCIDLDGDEDPDLLSAATLNDQITWYENLDGQGSYGEPLMIYDGANGASSVFAIDLDGDEDADVLSASMYNYRIEWYENLDGEGDFGEPQIITQEAEGARDVFAADLDGDGDADVLSASSSDDVIAWYENTDGAGDFGARQIITAEADGAQDVYAVDLDGDGDRDILSASTNDQCIAWHENLDGEGDFGERRIITQEADGACSVFCADLDGDDDLDLLSASYGDDVIAWYENLDGLGDFGEQRLVAEADGAYCVFSMDLDDDGASDVVSASAGDDRVAWYRNLGDVALEDPPRAARPRSARITSARPNPFNPLTRVRYELAQVARIRLAVYDLLGREVALLADAHRPAGSHETVYHAEGMASGVYFLRLQAGEEEDLRKILLIK